MIEPTLYTKPKSKLAAFALTFFFGPLGLFYVLAPGRALLVILGAFLAGVLSEGVLWFVAAIGCMIFAPIAVGQFNERLTGLQTDATNDILTRAGL